MAEICTGLLGPGEPSYSESPINRIEPELAIPALRSSSATTTAATTTSTTALWRRRRCRCRFRATRTAWVAGQTFVAIVGPQIAAYQMRFQQVSEGLFPGRNVGVGDGLQDGFVVFIDIGRPRYLTVRMDLRIRVGSRITLRVFTGTTASTATTTATLGRRTFAGRVFGRVSC